MFPALALALLFTGTATADPPLPDARELVGRLLEHQAKVDAVRENYTFKLRQVQFRPRGRGESLRWETKEQAVYQVYPSRTVPIERLLEKNGEPLNAKQEKKEDERIQKEIRDWEKRKARRERNSRAPAEAPESLPEDAPANPETVSAGQAADDEDEERSARELRLRDLLRASVLQTAARERENGRDLLVIDFEGDPAAKAKSRGEKLAKKLSGRMWVDEQDLQIVRADGRLGKMSIAGGIVAKLKSARFYFEQRRVDDQLWLPVRGEFEFSARVLLVKGIDSRFTADFYDYQRFGTAMSIAYEGAQDGPSNDPDCAETSSGEPLDAEQPEDDGH